VIIRSIDVTDMPKSILNQAISDLAVTATGFVFDPRSGQSFSVNDAGLAAIRAFREGLDLFETKARLIADFNAPSDVIESGLKSFLRQLNRHLA
jgi:hypothetical protein